MPKFPAITARKFIKALKKLEFVHKRTTGSHYIFIRTSDQIRISVPMHKGKDLGRGLTLSIIKNLGITPEDFLKLL